MPGRRVMIALCLLCAVGFALVVSGHLMLGGLLMAKSVVLYRLARVIPTVLAIIGPPPRRRRS